VFDWLLANVSGQEVVLLNTENSEIFFHHSKVSCVKNQRINPFFLYPCGKKYGITHTYEGWNFNSGTYLFTTDTK